LRIRGLGLPTGSGRRGDLLVTIDIAVPRHARGRERQAVEALADAITWSPRQDLDVPA
jgi:molecular chaperone DnaJ